LKANFRDALAALARAFPAFLPYAAFLFLGGMLVLCEFALVLICLRQVRIAYSQATVIAAAAVLSGGWLTYMIWQRFFLFRRTAAMLFHFSGAGPGQARASVNGIFPGYSSWMAMNRDLRRVLRGLRRKTEHGSGIWGRLAERTFSPVIYSLLFALGGGKDAIKKALALYWSHGQRTRLMAGQWLKLSALGLVLFFLCLAVPSWFFFSSAGAPLAVGVSLAAVIAWFLQRAFFMTLAHAGLSAVLLEETKGKEPDPVLADDIGSLLAAR
jgi:hypothetical protein